MTEVINPKDFNPLEAMDINEDKKLEQKEIEKLWLQVELSALENQAINWAIESKFSMYKKDFENMIYVNTYLVLT